MHRFYQSFMTWGQSLDLFRLHFSPVLKGRVERFWLPWDAMIQPMPSIRKNQKTTSNCCSAKSNVYVSNLVKLFSARRCTSHKNVCSVSHRWCQCSSLMVLFRLPYLFLSPWSLVPTPSGISIPSTGPLASPVTSQKATLAIPRPCLLEPRMFLMPLSAPYSLYA